MNKIPFFIFVLSGFAIEFCRVTLEEGLSNKANRQLFYTDMVYSDEYKFKVAQLLHETMVEPNTNSGFNRIFSRKDTYWSYENELRISAPLTSNGNKYYFPVDAIKFITLGQKMDEIKRVTLITVLKSIGINIDTQVKVAEINRKTLKLNIIPFNEANFD